MGPLKQGDTFLGFLTLSWIFHFLCRHGAARHQRKQSPLGCFFFPFVFLITRETGHANEASISRPQT